MGKKLKPMMRKLDIPIYDATIWLVVGGDSKRAKKKSIELFGDVADDWEFYYACVSWVKGKNKYVLWFSEYPMPCIITHETQHLT